MADVIKVVFATPTLGGKVALNFHQSMMQTAAVLRNEGIRAACIERDGDPYLARVRNRLLTYFCNRCLDATDLFWIDSDVGGYQPQKIVEFLRAPEEILAGIYPMKTPKVDFPWEPVFSEDTCDVVRNERGMLLTRIVPTGFLRMKRSAVEKLAAASDTFMAHDMTPEEIKIYNVFETGIGPGNRFWGEDCMMSEKWLRLGGELWVDPDIQFTHHGSGNWSGRLADHLHLYRERALAMKMLGKQAAE